MGGGVFCGKGDCLCHTVCFCHLSAVGRDTGGEGEQAGKEGKKEGGGVAEAGEQIGMLACSRSTICMFFLHNAGVCTTLLETWQLCTLVVLGCLSFVFAAAPSYVVHTPVPGTWYSRNLIPFSSILLLRQCCLHRGATALV